jgi:T5orf172 domain
MKSGYLYVLTHPSESDLYKIGVTIREPEIRLKEHNSNYAELAGQIAKATGKKWELKEFHAVPDPYWAEAVFWATTPFADIPYRYGVEIERMSRDQVQKSIVAAKNAGVRPKAGRLPDYVYAYTVWIRKRIEGRGIELLSHVRSIVSGKANFRCSDGHEWRATPLHVGEGQGCPECGVGKGDADEIRKKINAGRICLLTHPAKQGFIKIEANSKTLLEASDDNLFGEWEIHRHRNVEDLVLAEALIWELLEIPKPNGSEPVQKELIDAEEAMRQLIYAMHAKIALDEKAKLAIQKAL